MATPELGATYKYTGTVPIGGGNEGLNPGDTVVVRDLVLADEQGAHTSTEDAVVVMWNAPSIIKTENGNEVGYVERAMSVGLSGNHGPAFDAIFELEN